MNKEITFEICGTKAASNRTSITKMVWDDVAGTLALSGLHDALYDVIRFCGEHHNHLESEGGHEQAGQKVNGVDVLTAHCVLNGDSSQEKAWHLDGFIDQLAKNNYITQVDALRAKSEFCLQNVKAARAV